MKVYEERPVPPKPATTEKVCVRRKCDLCGVESKSEDWQGGAYDVNETEIRVQIKARDGYCGYGEGFGQEWEVDLCPACFKGRLIPWLQSQGAAVDAKDYDY